MRILISNDDGYFAPGIEHLAEALATHAEITVVAPERDRSGASNSLTLDRPLQVRRAPNGFLFVNGTPTDCVHLAVTGLLDELPDMVVSGINLGANMGDDTIYSGTVAAATEGFLLGIPSVAISLASKTAAHFETAAQVAVQLVRAPCAHRPPEPGCSTSTCRTSRSRELSRALAVTRLGRRHKAEPVIPHAEPARRDGVLGGRGGRGRRCRRRHRFPRRGQRTASRSRRCRSTSRNREQMRGRRAVARALTRAGSRQRQGSTGDGDARRSDRIDSAPASA